MFKDDCLHAWQVEQFAKEAEEWRSNYNVQRSWGESLQRRIVELEQMNSWLRQYNGVHVSVEYSVNKQPVEN